MAALLVPEHVADAVLTVEAEDGLLHVTWELGGRGSLRADLDAAEPSVRLD